MTFSNGVEDFTGNVQKAVETVGHAAGHMLKAVLEPVPGCPDGSLLQVPHTGLLKIDPEMVRARIEEIDCKLREAGVLPLLHIGLDEHCLPQIKIDCPPPAPFKTDCFSVPHAPGVLDGRAFPPGTPEHPNGNACDRRDGDKQPVDLFLHNLGELAKHPGLIINPRF